MSDFLSRARETAEREAMKSIQPRTMHFHGGDQADLADLDRAHFIDGFTAAVSRLPSEEEIAEVLEAQFRSAEMPWLSESPVVFACEVRELIERMTTGAA